MIFNNVNAITIPEGDVKSITIGGIKVWEAVSPVSELWDITDRARFITNTKPSTFSELYYYIPLRYNGEWNRNINSFSISDSGDVTINTSANAVGLGMPFTTLENGATYTWKCTANYTSNIRLLYYNGNTVNYTSLKNLVVGQETTFSFVYNGTDYDSVILLLEPRTTGRDVVFSNISLTKES